MKKRTVALLMAAVLLFGAAMGGTLALLTQKTETITNTFTAGKVSITLTETEPSDKTIKVIPGKEVTKNPTITVKDGSEACYVFVKVDAADGLSTYVTYTVDTANWKQVDGETNVWYKEFSTTVSGDQALNILTGNKVAFSNALTAAQVSGIPQAGLGLSFTGYAVQKEGVASVTAAWEIAEALV